MDSQSSTFMALSGLAAANIYLTDPRPAWIWAEDGKTILWANPAGAAFFGVRSLRELADLSGLSRAPARPHIARVATSGPIDRDTTDRLRFYRGLRVMLLTCACRRLALADGSNGALIVALDAPDAAQEADEETLLDLVGDDGRAAFLYRRDGSVAAGDATLAGPPLDAVKAALRGAKHAPLRTRFEIGGALREAAVLMLDSGSILLLADMAGAGGNTAGDDEPGTTAALQAGTGPGNAVEASVDRSDATGPKPALEDGPTEPAASAPAPVETAPAVPRLRRAAGGLFAFASGTRFLSSPKPATAGPADEGAAEVGTVDAGRQPDAIRPVSDETFGDAEVAVVDTADEPHADQMQDEADRVEPDTVPGPAPEGDAPSAADSALHLPEEPEPTAASTTDDLTETGAEPFEPFGDAFADSDEDRNDTQVSAVAEAAPVDMPVAPQGDAWPDATPEDVEPVDDAVRDTLDAADVPAEEPAVSASGFVFVARERPVRFAWKMDIDRRFTFLSPEFAEALGPEAADVVGLTWEEVADRLGIDADGKVASALRRRDTWSGRTLDWPVSGAALRVPVDMAALPAFDRQRVFEGFRGFGVCRTGDAVEDPDATGTRLSLRPTAVAADSASDTEAEAEADGHTEVEDMADMPADAGRADPHASGDIPSGDASQGDRSAEVPSSGDIAVGQPETSPSLHETESLIRDDGASSSMPDEDSDADEPADTGQSLLDLGAVPDPAPEEEPTVPKDRPTRHAPIGGPFRDEAVDTSRLSKPEREAFRKIAEALGARSESDEPQAVAAAPESGLGSAVDEGALGRVEETAVEDVAADAADGGNVATETADAETKADTEAPSDGTPETTASNVASLGIVPRTQVASRATRTSLLDKLPVGVAVIDGEEVDYVNATLLDLLGYPDIEALQAVGGLEAIFAEPEDWPSSLPGAMTERTMRIRLADGGAKPVKARLNSVPWKEGTALMMSLLDRHDPAQEAALDRLHETQSALSLAEEHLAEMDAVLETATDGVLILDDSGRIVKVNRSAEALFDAAREDMIGAPLTDYLAPESHRDASDYLDGLARNGVASVLNDGREVIGQLRSGGLIPLFMTIGRVGHGAEGPRFCTVLRDITQWKTAEEELTDAKRQAENASSQKSDFLAKISHEIRTPLNAIIGFSEVMMEERFGPVGNDRYKGYLRDIHNSGSHIMSLINDLLDLSKIEAGKLDLTFEAVSANDIIRECVALMQPQANRERVIIRASLPTSVPKIVADGRSVRQIVLNLLSNAIKFNQPGGQVIVSTALEDSGEVILRVRDTGMGMSHQDLAAAMEPFRQLHTARHGGGTGLGLPLTKALVEANRASFRIDSEVNHGTLVEVTFPPQRVLAE
jgi:PAS domain S-box-containing protein